MLQVKMTMIPNTTLHSKDRTKTNQLNFPTSQSTLKTQSERLNNIQSKWFKASNYE
uniref:Uncharacterized protein n=1 Tax=Nelumbo nucifera TaxID=4432 RepID=A0A822XGD2_NELNU|nr:TPA_asm: hypothetical protein HUJ06_019539 [Nelumbo nucifera]